MNKQAKQQSRMFRTLVLMGSGIALSCGGRAQEDGGSSSSGGSGAAGKPSTGATAGASNGSGGSNTGSGGSGFSGNTSSAFGGTGTIGVGGTLGLGGTTSGTAGAAAGGSSNDHPTQCPPSQWTCSNSGDCDYETGWTPTGCKCDFTRPKTAADCAMGQVFTCRSTSNDGSTPYGFDCSCVAADPDARCTCSSYGGQDFYDQCDTTSVPDTTLCGCAIVLLK